MKSRPTEESLLPAKRNREEDGEDDEDEDSPKRKQQKTEDQEETNRLGDEKEQEEEEKEEPYTIDTETPNKSDEKKKETKSETDQPALSPEEALAQFKQLLREHKVTPFSRWEKEEAKLAADRRFHLLPTQKLRRQAFDDYTRNRAQEQLLETQQATEEYKLFLKTLLSSVDAAEDYVNASSKHRFTCNGCSLMFDLMQHLLFCCFFLFI
jgi:hypothetical protein